jgi:hypothetical protein
MGFSLCVGRLVRGIVHLRARQVLGIDLKCSESALQTANPPALPVPRQPGLFGRPPEKFIPVYPREPASLHGDETLPEYRVIDLARR